MLFQLRVRCFQQRNVKFNNRVGSIKQPLSTWGDAFADYLLLFYFFFFTLSLNILLVIKKIRFNLLFYDISSIILNIIIFNFNFQSFYHILKLEFFRFYILFLVLFLVHFFFILCFYLSLKSKAYVYIVERYLSYMIADLKTLFRSVSKLKQCY